MTARIRAVSPIRGAPADTLAAVQEQAPSATIPVLAAAAAAFERVVEAMYRIRYEGISPGHRERRRARLLVGRLRTALRGA